MEKFLNPYDREYMRMAMLKHEETFKEQVYELHRLYRIQKILMRNIESNRSNPQNQEPPHWSSRPGFSFKQIDQGHHIQEKSTIKLDLEGPAEENFLESNSDHKVMEHIDESEIELTLGPASYSRRNYKKLETPLTSDSGPSFSSSSTGSSHINRTSSLTKNAANKAREEASGPGLAPLQVPDMSLGYQSESRSSIDVEKQLSQERLKQPSWLFQVLSLNMT